MSFQLTFKALSDPTRRQILELLKGGRLTAGEIGASFSMTAPTVSHHLSVLREAGLIDDEKVGKYIYYELNLSVVEEILTWATSLKGDKHDET